ncbi:MAG TPA: hypothetical protein VGB38_09570 [bacterium]
MTNGTAAAVIAEAVKASGAIVEVTPKDFLTLVGKADKPLVVQAKGIWPASRCKYLFGYKGLVFYTKAKDVLPLPSGTERIQSRKIWIPV